MVFLTAPGKPAWFFFTAPAGLAAGRPEVQEMGSSFFSLPPGNRRGFFHCPCWLGPIVAPDSQKPQGIQGIPSLLKLKQTPAGLAAGQPEAQKWAVVFFHCPQETAVVFFTGPILAQLEI